MQLAQKIAFVTGGSKRVGREIALTLAQHGCHVAISYLTSRVEAQKTAQDISTLGTKSVAVQGDVSKKSDVVRMAKIIERRLGPVDILINNASMFQKTPWPTILEKAWDKHLQVNLRGPFFCAQVFAPGMVSRRSGKIINIVDCSGERPYRNYLPYCVSKAGLVGLTKALAKELAPHVHVNAIGPGPVLLPQEMSEQEKSSIFQNLPLGRLGSPEDIANAVLFLTQGTDFATGSVFYIDGGRLIA